jgi:hypothetical protein
MADFQDYNDQNQEGTNVNVVDSSDPSKKARVITDENGIDRLQTSANLDSGQLVPTITNKFRIRHAIGDVNLTAGSYTTVFTRSGTGLFFGFQIGYDHQDVLVRLTIDGGQVFEISLDDVREFQFNDTTTTRTQMGGFLTTIGNTFDFSSKFAIPYETSLLIETKTTSGTHKMRNWIVFLTEDS